MKTDIEKASEEARIARHSESETSRRSSFKRHPVRRTLSGRSQWSQVSWVKNLVCLQKIYFAQINNIIPFFQ